MCDAFKSKGLEFIQQRNRAKLLKSLSKEDYRAVFLEYGEPDFDELVRFSQEAKSLRSNLSLTVLWPGPLPLFPPEVDLEGVDLILSLDQDLEHLKERVAREIKFELTPDVEGRGQKGC